MPLTRVLGTMTFGWSKASTHLSASDYRALLDEFSASGNTEIDTALIYMDAPGVAEKILGELIGSDARFVVHSKAHPTLGTPGISHSAGGGLSAEELRSQIEQSLNNLKIGSLPLLYLHQPDTGTKLEETLRACNDLHKQGLFHTLGLSNYHSSEVRLAHEICARHGWIRPTVYQGNYNALNRDVEAELFPVLNELNIRFLAYNPLAAGLLSGKYAQKEKIPDSGRFANNKNYVDRYWKEDTFAAMERLRVACEAEGITVLQAAFSWLCNHSQLNPHKNDGIVLGVSNMAQLKENLAATDSPARLSPSILAVLEESWDSCKAGAFPYSRGLSGAGGDASVGITK